MKLLPAPLQTGLFELQSSSCLHVSYAASHRLLSLPQDYKATQKIAAEREAQYMPKVPPAVLPRAVAGSSAAAAAAAAGDGESAVEAQALLQEQKLQESRALENT